MCSGICESANLENGRPICPKICTLCGGRNGEYKIPASITLAQGLLETGGGQVDWHNWGKIILELNVRKIGTGKTMSHTDDAPNECFRVNEDPKQSYEDHS